MYFNGITDNNFTAKPAGGGKPPKITLIINRTNYFNAAETIAFIAWPI